MRWSTSNIHQGFTATSIALVLVLLSTPSHPSAVMASPVVPQPNILEHNHIDGDLFDSSFISGQAFADASNIIAPAKPSLPRRILLQLQKHASSAASSSSSRPSPSPQSPQFLSAYETIVNSDSQLPMFLDHKLQQRQQHRRARVAKMLAKASAGKISEDPQPHQPSSLDHNNSNNNDIDANEALPRIATNNVQNNMAENAMRVQGPGDEVGEVTHDLPSTPVLSSEATLTTDKNRSALRNSRGMEEEDEEGVVVVDKKEEEATFIVSETHMEEKASAVAPEDLFSGMQDQELSSEGVLPSERPSSQTPSEVQVEHVPIPEVEPIVVFHSERDVLEPRSIHKRSSPIHRHRLATSTSSSPSSRSTLHSALASAFVMAASGLALSFIVISYSMYSRRREKSPLGFFHYLTQGVFDSSYSSSYLSEVSSLPVATIPSPTNAAFPSGVSSSCSGDSSEEPEIAVSSCTQMTSSAYRADVGRRASRQLLVESKVELLF
ncbi:hypothetical protein CPC16_006061 [Podila verticillata]|nr:hypothetical protein CPC16_006061 [Podila verticillata]